jgi:cytoskeletal protein CcmA (bactofilin family)
MAHMENSALQDSGESVGTSVIGAGITVTGNIEASVDLHVLGTVNGDVRCATLVLGERSIIRGSVYAERVRASGTIEGAIEAKDLAVEPTARVTGDVTYARIRLANGGIIDGRMKYKPHEENEGAKLRLVEHEPKPKRKTLEPPEEASLEKLP